MVGQGAGQAVALCLVVQAAALRGGDVDHQREPPGRRLQEGAGSDGAGDRADQVEVAIADQEPAVVVEQLPGQRQHEVVVAADRDQRPGLAGNGRRVQKLERFSIEQQVKQQTAERGGGAVQKSAGTIVVERLTGQAGELDAGDGEAGLNTPRRRVRPGRAAGGVVDGHRITLGLQHEDEVLAEVELADVALGQLAAAAHQCDQFAGDADGVEVPGVNGLDRVQIRRQGDIFEQDRQEPAGGWAMGGEERGPLRHDPLAAQRLGREHQRHRSAIEHRPAEAEDPVVAWFQIALVLEDLETVLFFKLGLQATNPLPVGCAVRQEDVVVVGRCAGIGHGLSPRMPAVRAVSAGVRMPLGVGLQFLENSLQTCLDPYYVIPGTVRQRRPRFMLSVGTM